jgi:hypothetical protein
MKLQTEQQVVTKQVTKLPALVIHIRASQNETPTANRSKPVATPRQSPTRPDADGKTL